MKDALSSPVIEESLLQPTRFLPRPTMPAFGGFDCVLLDEASLQPGIVISQDHAPTAEPNHGKKQHITGTYHSYLSVLTCQIRLLTSQHIRIAHGTSKVLASSHHGRCVPRLPIRVLGGTQLTTMQGQMPHHACTWLVDHCCMAAVSYYCHCGQQHQHQLTDTCMPWLAGDLAVLILPTKSPPPGGLR